VDCADTWSEKLIVTVEALIKCQAPQGDNPKAYEVGDIITIQPAGHGWGTGDLQGKIVVCVDLDLPCGKDFMVKKRCSQCEYQGIDWGDKTALETGDTGTPKITCPKEKYIQADVTFEYELTEKGIPTVNSTLNKKKRAKIDLDDVLSAESKTLIQSETSLDKDTKDERLLTARKDTNKLLESSISVKSIVSK